MFTPDENADILRMVKAMKRGASTYEVNTDVAKRVINQDKFTRDDGRIMVDVPGEAPVTDMMMPAPTEPSDGYAPSVLGAGGFPPMVIILCEQTEDVSPNELQAKLAEVFRVDPARFAVTIADA
jgi:hypothetical protein